LPKVVTQRCLEQDLNLRPTHRKPKCLTRYTTAPPQNKQRKKTEGEASDQGLLGKWPSKWMLEQISRFAYLPFSCFIATRMMLSSSFTLSDMVAVLFCSLAVLDLRVGHTMYVLSPSLSSVILIDSSTGSSVHVLMLSIQAVCGLPHVRAPGIVPCIIW